MGFFGGVVTGLAVAAGAAAWFMSRSGARVREQYNLDQRLGEIGDQLEARTRDIQSTVNAQLAQMQGKAQAVADDVSTNGHTASDTLDDVTASAAEAAASTAAEADEITARIKKSTKDVAEGSTES